MKAEGCWSPLCESDARFLRNDFYKVTQSGWPLWQNQQMDNWNGLIGPLTTLPSSHLFLRATLLLRLIAAQITVSFCPICIRLWPFCSPTDANEKGGIRQLGWRKQPRLRFVWGPQTWAFTAGQDRFVFHEQHKSIEPSCINQCSKPFAALWKDVWLKMVRGWGVE